MKGEKPFLDEDLLEYLKGNSVMIDDQLNLDEKKKLVDDANKIIGLLKTESKKLGFDIYRGIGNVVDLVRVWDKSKLIFQLAVFEGTGYQEKGRGFLVVEKGIEVEQEGLMRGSIWGLARMFEGYGLSVKLIEEKKVMKVGGEQVVYRRKGIGVFDDGVLGFLSNRSKYYLVLFCDQLMSLDLNAQRGVRALNWELVPRKAVVEHGSKKKVRYLDRYIEEDVLSRELRR